MGTRRSAYPLAFVLLASLGCPARQAGLPLALSALQPRPVLVEIHGLQDLVALPHPEYADDIYCAHVVVENRGFTDYLIGFYARTGETYELIDTTLTIGGYSEPVCENLGHLGRPGFLARSLADGEEAYFFIEDGQLESATEHPEAWTEIPRP